MTRAPLPRRAAAGRARFSGVCGWVHFKRLGLEGPAGASCLRGSSRPDGPASVYGRFRRTGDEREKLQAQRACMTSSGEMPPEKTWWVHAQAV